MAAALPEPLPALIALAAESGLVLRATLPTEPLGLEQQERHRQWLDSGRAGEMEYLQETLALGADLRSWKSWAGGALLFGLPYHRAGGGFRGGGQVARYALGKDYHHVLGRRIEKMGRRLQRAGLTKRFRRVVDAAPVLEREWAIRGQVGFRGKNTLLLHPEHGPWILLGELLIEADLPAWAPPPARQATCGSCTRCLDACPTSAFDGPYLLDPRRCLSYLTIESKGWIPKDLRTLAGSWVYGCDVCLEVCPFGAKDEDHAGDWGTHPVFTSLSLEDLLTVDQQVFDRLFTGSPLRRAGWEGLLRNACVVLGNLKTGGPVLEWAAEGHPSALVRGHAIWALAQMDLGRGARERAARQDPDSAVRTEATTGL